MMSQQTGKRRLIDADVLLDKTVRRNRTWNSITNSEGKNLEEIVSEISSVTPQEPKTDVLDKIKTEICKKHLSIMERNDFDNGRTYAYDEVIEIIDKYREQEPKTGHWIDEVTLIGAKICRCSECNFIIQKPRIKNNFCPNCGAKMVDPQESEDEDN